MFAPSGLTIACADEWGQAYPGQARRGTSRASEWLSTGQRARRCVSSQTWQAGLPFGPTGRRPIAPWRLTGSNSAMTVFFTSDTHFGHAGARGLYRRPFALVAELDTAMLDRWNTTVGPEDEIWHLGDFAFGVPEAAMAVLLGRLHGHKHLHYRQQRFASDGEIDRVDQCPTLCRDRAGWWWPGALPLPSGLGATRAAAGTTCMDTAMATWRPCCGRPTSASMPGISGR